MKAKRLVSWLAAASIAFLPAAAARAFNPATHIYVAEHVYPQHAWSVDFDYGSIAPDIDQYVADPARWPTAYLDTHRDYSDITPFAIGRTQRLFAAGWRSHGEICGADRYAHLDDPFAGDGGGGYVMVMAAALQGQIPGLPDNVAHFAVEAAVDLLMRNNVDRSLGQKVSRANLLRSREDRSLLTRVLVLGAEPRTDFVTLASAEITFRSIVQRYAAALALPSPLNLHAVAALGAELSESLFGQPATKEEILAVLRAAVVACRGTYRPAVDAVVARVVADPACH